MTWNHFIISNHDYNDAYILRLLNSLSKALRRVAVTSSAMAQWENTCLAGTGLGGPSLALKSKTPEKDESLHLSCSLQNSEHLLSLNLQSYPCLSDVESLPWWVL